MEHPPGSPLSVVLALLYGREHDLSRLLTLIRSGARLLTLRGPGGIGKTTLALHLAQALKALGESSPLDHVQLIDLSAVRDPDSVLGLIAASLPDSGLKGDPQRRIQAFVSNRRVLLILDNFEQLLPAAPSLGDLLSATVTLQLVITSRAALRLHDEVEYPVAPLELAHRARDAASSAAVQLFVARVQSVRPSFELNATTTPQVMRLCEALEGVPLALELAAVRMRSLSLGDLLARLDHPLQVLKADFRDRPERLRSLRAAVQWSYDLLSEEERAVFECCAVFNGPFTPQALGEVWGAPDVLDQAEGLLEQSLLQRVDSPETLWKILQPLKELALERLEGHPRGEEWRERHALYYLQMIEERERIWMLKGVDLDGQGGYLTHYPNIRAGLVWTTEARRSDLAYRYLFPIYNFWLPLGLTAQEAPLVDRVMALPQPEDRFTLFQALQISLMVFDRNLVEARKERLHEVLAMSRELEDVEAATDAQLTLANVALDIGLLEQAWGIIQQARGELRERMGDRPPTRVHQFRWGRVLALSSLTLQELGRAEEALEYARQAAQSFQELGKSGIELLCSTNLGYMLAYTGRFEEGQAQLLSCLYEAVRRGFQGLAELSLARLTLVAAEVRAWTSLVQITGYLNDPLWEDPLTVGGRRLREDLGRARDALGEAAYQQAWMTGTGLSLEDVVDLADQLAPPPASPVLYPELTPREREVLALVSQGHPDRKVARLLGITPRTASKHVGNLLGKLGLRNRVELARWAIEHALPHAGS
ncbi:LuxR C-terminal-related transcriptional regulator (plasmid) [Deinococcus radiomollis]|uniref:ATP-binding protein n=1 Tax=Deinococcus radiomollis TaxID=468916 RepID=UPI00389218E9